MNRSLALYFSISAIILSVQSCEDGQPSRSALCVSAPSGLIALWTGDSTFMDHSRAFKTYTSGFVTSNTGFVSEGYVFDSLGGIISVQDTSALDLENSLSIAAWVRFRVPLAMQPDFNGSAWDDYHFLVEKGNGGFATRNYGLYFGKTQDVLEFSGIGHGGTSYVFNATIENVSDIVDDLEWHLFVAVWDRQTQTATVYVDGSVAATSQGSDLPLMTNAYPLRIGAATPGMYFFDGSIDEIMLFDRALSSVDVGLLVAAGSNGVCR